MSRIVLPYERGRLRHLTRLMAPRRAELMEMMFSESYWVVLRALWKDREAFAIVEHDMVLMPGSSERMLRCAEPWCAQPYLMASGYHDALGSVSFKSSIMVAVPDVFSGPNRGWQKVDSHLTTRLREEGFTPHLHRPRAWHLNREQRRQGKRGRSF